MNEKPYTPELGQMIFGQPWSELDCPEWIVALLERLADEIWRVTNNNDGYAHAIRPTDNEGSHFSNETFSMHAYYWGDDCSCPIAADGEHADAPCDAECPSCRANFRCGDFEVRWYKHARRGTSCNRIPEPSEMVAIFERCYSSVRAMELPLDEAIKRRCENPAP